MRKNILFYFSVSILLVLSFVFFNGAYRELAEYTALTNRTDDVYAGFEDLLESVNNAAVSNPDLLKASDSLHGTKLFYADSLSVIERLDFLKATVRDSINIRIAGKLDSSVRSELPWLLKSNVPDSIIAHKALVHIAALQRIDSLIDQGLHRTDFLLHYRRNKLDEAFTHLKVWMTLFILFAAALLIYSTVHRFRQKNQSEKRFQVLIEHSDDIIAMLDQKMHPFYRSPSAERIMGHRAEDRKGEVKIDEVHPEDRAKVEKCLLEVKENPGKAIHVTYRMKHKQGHYVWLEGTFTGLLHDPDVKAIVANMRDVSKRVEAERRIAASESFNRGVLNSLSSHIAVINASGTIVAVNESWKRFALENGDAGLQGSGPGSNYFAVCEQSIAANVEGAAEALQGLKDVMDQKTALFYLEYPCHSPDVERWFAMRVMKFDSDEPMVVVAHENITKIKKAERDLTQSLKVITDYKFALDQASIVAITDKKGIIRFVNENFCKISRFSREELIGQDHRIVNSGYHHKEFMKNLWITIAGGNVWRDEIKNRAKDGTYYWVDTTIVPFLDDHGKPFQYVAIRADITKRKEAEESLQRNESRLNEAQSMSHTGNWESDLVKNSDVWSDELYSIFGIEKNDVTPSPELFLSFIHPDEIDAARKKIRGTFLTHEAGSFDFRFFRKDGITRHGYAEWRFEFDGNRHPVRLYGIVQDITERKRAEEEREKMISNIIVHSRNLEQFTYIVSHNLRGPVANILGISEVLKGDITEAERKRGQQFLQVAVRQMDQVLIDLNKILQIRSQVTEIKEPVSLTALVNEIEANLKSLVESEDVHISVDFSAVDKLLSIKSYMHSIFFNLVLNSIKYRKPGIPSQIHIASSLKNGRVQISFRDNGTGINMSRYSDQIFGLYKRFHPNTEGKGMGLFMVKTQVETMGGSIRVESEPGTGTEFVIELPE